MNSKVMTSRQERFASEYVICGNAAEAARRAGYSAGSAKVTGCRLLTNANLKGRIEALQQANSKELELTHQDVISAVLGAIELAKEQGAPAVMLKGWATVAKITGLDKPEPVLAEGIPLSKSAGRLRMKLETLSDEELLAIIESSNKVMLDI